MGWGLGLSVLAPFWNRPHWPVRLHSFVNLGKVVGYEKSELFYISVGLELTDQIEVLSKMWTSLSAIHQSAWDWVSCTGKLSVPASNKLTPDLILSV
jgi:hypothetical protein